MIILTQKIKDEIYNDEIYFKIHFDLYQQIDTFFNNEFSTLSLHSEHKNLYSNKIMTIDTRYFQKIVSVIYNELQTVKAKLTVATLSGFMLQCLEMIIKNIMRPA